jgi:hypothetical protein
MRTLVRRRLHETVADDWDDSTLNTFLNLAYALVQKQVRKVDPEALVFWDYRNTVANTVWYEKPAGSRGSFEVGLKTAAADTDWTALVRKPYYLARSNSAASDRVYCHRGLYIGIFPAPTVAVTNGLQLLHAPTDTMSTDTESPKLEDTLHYAIVLWATIIAKGESPEENDSKEAAELNRIINDIPSDYGSIDLGQSLQLNPDVSAATGRYGSGNLLGNGIFTR